MNRIAETEQRVPELPEHKRLEQHRRGERERRCAHLIAEHKRQRERKLRQLRHDRVVTVARWSLMVVAHAVGAPRQRQLSLHFA